MTRLIGARCKIGNNFSQGVLIFHLFNHKNCGDIDVTYKQSYDIKSSDSGYFVVNRGIFFGF